MVSQTAQSRRSRFQRQALPSKVWWKNELLEKYDHTNMALNPGLSDKGFDPTNEEL